MDCKVHSVLAGRDFHLSVDRFANQLRQKAYRSGMSIWVQSYEINENGPTGPVQYWLTFRFEPKADPEPTVKPTSTHKGLDGLTVEELWATDPRFRPEG
jgi:hypothetical protein